MKKLFRLVAFDEMQPLLLEARRERWRGRRRMGGGGRGRRAAAGKIVPGQVETPRGELIGQKGEGGAGHGDGQRFEQEAAKPASAAPISWLGRIVNHNELKRGRLRAAAPRRRGNETGPPQG